MKLPFLKKDVIVPTVISYIFHPLIMPTIGVWIIFNSGSILSMINPMAQLKILGIVFAMTFLFPALLLPIFVVLRWIGSIEASERNERIFPIAITAIIYYFTFTFLKNQQVLLFIALFILAISIVMILLMIVNFFSKVSLHMAGIGGIGGLTLYMSMVISPINGWFFVLSILLAGIIAFARLKLNEHKPAQIFAGYFIGFLPVLTLFILVNILIR